MSWSLAKSWNWYREVAKNTAFYQKRCDKLCVFKNRQAFPLFNLCQGQGEFKGKFWIELQQHDDWPWTKSPLKFDAFWHEKKILNRGRKCWRSVLLWVFHHHSEAAFDRQLGVPERIWFRNSKLNIKWYKVPFIRDRPWKLCFWSFGISSWSQAGSPFGFEIVCSWLMDFKLIPSSRKVDWFHSESA